MTTSIAFRIPTDVIMYILMFVDDIDIRRAFHIYQKINKNRYSGNAFLPFVTKDFDHDFLDTRNYRIPNLIPRKQEDFVDSVPTMDMVRNGLYRLQNDGVSIRVKDFKHTLQALNIRSQPFLLIEFHMWRLKRKTGEKRKEVDPMYHVDAEHFWDFSTYKYKMFY